MEHIKLAFLLVLFCAVGLVFVGVGLYFLSEKNLNCYDGKKSMAKAAGFVSLALGILTVITGIAMYAQPQLLEYLVIIYLIVLILVVSCAMIVLKKKK
jgi:Ni,Fe-hydrogenase I cytochrome b subunit